MLQQLHLVVEAAILLTLCVLVLRIVHSSLELPGRLFQILLGAFALRVGAAIIVDSLGVFAGQFDFFKYEAALWTGAQLLREGVLTAPLEIASVYAGSEFYIVYSALYSPIYAVFGHHTLLIRIAGAFVGTVFVLNVYRVGKCLHSHEAGFYAAVLAAVFPYWIYLSTSFYRDMLTMVILSQVLYALLRFERSRTASAASTAVAFAGFAFLLRPENLLSLGVAFGVAGAVYLSERQPALRIFVPIAIALAVLRLFNTIVLHGNVLSLHRITKKRRFLAYGSGAYLENVAFTRWFELLSFVPIGTAYFLLVPLPWQVRDVLSLLAVLQNFLIWYPMVILAVVGVPYLVSERPLATLMLVGFAASGIVVYGLVEGNVGPALRHRSQFQIVFVVFASIAVVERIGSPVTSIGVNPAPKARDEQVPVDEETAPP